MMRELKFRFFDERLTNSMIYENWSDRKDLIFEKWEKTPKASPIMQYTGLKDKNGKEIYEGDIVVCWSGEQADYLDYRELEGVVNYEAPYWQVSDNHLAWNAEFIEIIGNKYEEESK